MSQPETAWIPGPDDMPGTINLINLATGDRHLSFNDHEGRFYRLWQHHDPEPLHTGEAILLRPSDVDQIIQTALLWVHQHPGHPRGEQIGAEIAAGAKAAVVHFATLAGAY